MKKTIFCLAAAFAGFSLFAQSGGTAERLYSLMAVAAAVTQVNKDEEAIKGILTTLEKGWNAKSGETFSSVFADVHDYIVVNGMYFPGFTQKGNAAAHQSLFDGVYKTYDIKLKADKVTFFRPDLAQVVVIGAGYTKGGAAPQDPTIIMTLMVEKKGEDWKIISFHNHELNTADIQQRSPMPLKAMYASWYR